MEIKATKDALIGMIEAAQSAWDSCDWTHDAPSEDGERVVCDGGDEDTCDYCRRATAAAKGAIAIGDHAITAIRAGDINRAKSLVEQARSIESEWGDCPAWREVAGAMEAIETYDDAYPTSDARGAVDAAIKHANWFCEEDDRLRKLAINGKAQEIRDWADEIRNDFNGDTEDDAYWRVTADMWDAVADAVDALREQTERA